MAQAAHCSDILIFVKNVQNHQVVALALYLMVLNLFQT